MSNLCLSAAVFVQFKLFVGDCHFEKEVMPRILKADLVAENQILRSKLAAYEAAAKPRSRSPRGRAESAKTTHRALDLVCKFERDSEIQVLHKEIARRKGSSWRSLAECNETG